MKNIILAAMVLLAARASAAVGPQINGNQINAQTAISIATFTVTGAGNTGIGTASAGRKLDVLDSTNNEIIRASRASLGDGIGLGVDSQGVHNHPAVYASGTEVMAYYGGGFALGSYATQTQDPPANGLVMSGFLGVGTANPATKIHMSSGTLTVDGTAGAINVPAGTVTAATFSGAGTSLTGTAASLTAGNVTTNANLTGPITSVGNATTIVGPVPTAAVDLSTVTTALALKAPLASPSFTGTVTAAGLTTSSTTILTGVIDGSSAASGTLGEFLSNALGMNQTPASSAGYVALSTITLTAGDWDVSASGELSAGATSAITQIIFAISTSNTSEDSSLYEYNNYAPASTAIVMNGDIHVSVPGPRRINVTTLTPVYLVGRLIYTVLGGALFTTSCRIQARRIR